MHGVTLPLVPGVDPSGFARSGPGVTGRKVGDRVVTQLRVSEPTANEPPRLMGVHTWGGYAEYVKVAAETTTIIPDGVDFPTATVVARHAPTAFFLLRKKAQLKAGQWVLVMGAAGGLGSVGVQAAKYLGAKVIAAAGADDRVKVGSIWRGRRDQYRSGFDDQGVRITEGRG